MKRNEIKHFTLFSSLLKLASVEVSLSVVSPLYMTRYYRLAVDEVYLRAASL